MHALLWVGTALLFPVGLLLLLLWLGHLEDTLDLQLKQTGRKPAPAPIRAIPVTHASSRPADPQPATTQRAESSGLSAAS
jgi:hypothetical protein